MISYPFGTSTGRVCKRELTRYSTRNNIMISFGHVTGGNTQEHNSDWRQIPGQQFRIILAGGSGLVKPNVVSI